MKSKLVKKRRAITCEHALDGLRTKLIALPDSQLIPELPTACSQFKDEQSVVNFCAWLRYGIRLAAAHRDLGKYESVEFRRSLSPAGAAQIACVIRGFQLGGGGK